MTATAAFLSVYFCASVVQAEPLTEPDRIFADNSTLEVTISAPFTSIMDVRSVDEETPGKLQYTNSEGVAVEFDVAIRSRGLYRRRADICRFAPIRLNFKKSQTRDTLFDKQDKVKIVTHCQPRSGTYEQTVITEYLAYRILNLLTDMSFRVRLLRVTYKDTDRSGRETVNYAVLIEHRDRLANRIDATVFKTNKVRIGDLRPEHTNIASVFQYLIGNTDFSPVAGRPDDDCCHNYVLFDVGGEKLVSVPYDFDQSGLVNAPHASANPRFRLKSVKSRLYRGRCFNNVQLPASLARFREKREEIDALMREQPSLASGTKKRVLAFVAAFYKTIDNPKRVEKRLVKKCI